MDNLEYHYDNIANQGLRNTNKLLSVTDNTDNSGNTSYDGLGDLQSGQLLGDNYTYDEIGNLIEDKQEEIEEIIWTVSGKVKKIIRDAGSTKPDIEFYYDASGNRIKKKVIAKDVSVNELANIEETYYICDAQGNIMSTYYKKYSINGSSQIDMSFTLAYQNMFGSSRLGSYTPNIVLANQIYNITGGNAVLANTNIASHNANYSFHLKGFKHFELSNHLGNVLATVSDSRVPVFTTGTNYFTNFNAVTLTANMYYPFGMIMPGRSFNPSEYRFGFQGQEKDDEINGSPGANLAFKYRIYDSRIGKFLSVDPLFKDYPWNSTYAFAENRVIDGIDLEGAEWESCNKKFNKNRGKTAIKKFYHLNIKRPVKRLFHKPKKRKSNINNYSVVPSDNVAGSSDNTPNYSIDIGDLTAGEILFYNIPFKANEASYKDDDYSTKILNKVSDRLNESDESVDITINANFPKNDNRTEKQRNVIDNLMQARGAKIKSTLIKQGVDESKINIKMGSGSSGSTTSEFEYSDKE